MPSVVPVINASFFLLFDDDDDDDDDDDEADIVAMSAFMFLLKQFLTFLTIFFLLKYDTLNKFA